MPAYGFMPKFVGKCLDGTKPHTIRALRKDGRVPKVGEPFIAYCGMRQPSCTWLFTSTIANVEPILMQRSGSNAHVWCGDVKPMNGGAATILAVMDGFDSTNEFFAHFLPTGVQDFHGYLIHWKPEDAKNTRHHCPDCGSRVEWCEAARGFTCVCTMAERTHRFKRHTRSELPALAK